MTDIELLEIERRGRLAVIPRPSEARRLASEDVPALVAFARECKELLREWAEMERKATGSGGGFCPHCGLAPGAVRPVRRV